MEGIDKNKYKENFKNLCKFCRKHFGMSIFRWLRKSKTKRSD